MSKPEQQLNVRACILYLFYWMLGISILLMIASYTDQYIRLFYLATMGCALLTGLVYGIPLLRSHPRWRIPLAALLAVLILWWIFGDRPIDRQHLRQTYLARLKSFTGAYYIWGGESHLGIDCSGLARTALWEAMLVDGIGKGNPRLLGVRFWSFWWHDVGANDLEKGTYGYTHVIGHADKLAGFDTHALQPGDMAVAAHDHVLIFLGGNRWIEASPNDGKVVSNAALPGSRREYFLHPVTLVRWRMLDDEQPRKAQ